MIRADIYALVRRKGLYISFAVMLLMNVLMVSTSTIGGIHMGGVGEVGLEPLDYLTLSFTGIGTVKNLYLATDMLLFILLPLVAAVAAPIFAYGTVKNDIAVGISRTKLYLIKLLVSVGLCAVMFVFYMGTGILLATIDKGWGGPAPAGFWSETFLVLGSQFVLFIAVICVVVFVAFVTRREGGSVFGISIFGFMVPGFILMLLMEAGFNVECLITFDLLSGLNRLGFFGQLETRNILAILGVALLYIIAATVGGIFLFKRAEIK
jgi:hypothetical protein